MLASEMHGIFFDRSQANRDAGSRLPLLLRLSVMTSQTPSALEAALRDAVAMSAWTEVISMIETNWTLLTRTNQGLLVDAVNALPSSVLAKNPRLSAAKTYVNYLPVNGDVRPIRFLHAPAAAPGALLDVLADLTSRSVSARFDGDLIEAVRFVREALSTLEDASDDAVAAIRPVLPDIRVQWAITFELAGELVGANRLYERTFDEALAVENRRIAIKSSGSIALNYALAGNRLAAEQWLNREPPADATDTDSTEHFPLDTVRTTGGLARALLAANDLRFAEAADYLRSAPPADVDRETWALRLYVESGLARSSGKARQQLVTVRSTLATQPERHRTTGLNGWLATTAIAELQLSLGDVASAHETIKQLGSYDPLTAVDPARVLRAWVALRRGDARKSILIAAPGLSQTLSSSRVTAELLVALAAASLALNELDDARRHFASAMEILVVEKLDIVLLRLTAAERAILLPDLATDLEARLLAQLDAHEIVVTAPLSVVLTRREKVVLRYIVQGLGPTEIAEAEHLSRNTVKAQVSSLYRKLGVNDRSAALRAAISTPHLLA